MKGARRFTFDVGWVLIGTAVTYLISFPLRIVLARWLGAADLGLYQMVVTVQGIASLVASFGIGSALVKYVAEHKGDKDKLSQTVSSGLITTAMFGILSGITLYALSGTLAGVFQMQELAHPLRILALVFPFVSLQGGFAGLLNGLREMKAFALLVILRNLLMVLLIVAFVWLGFGVEGAVLGIVLSGIGGCFFGWFLSRRFFRPTLRDLKQNAKKMVLFGGQLFGANAVSLINNQADIVLIGYFLSTTEVGYYSVAVSFSMIFLTVPQAIQKITYPATSEYWSQNNHRALQTMLSKSMKYSACILLPMGLGIGFFTREIVTTLYGDEFVHAALPLCVLLIARVIRGSTDIPIGASFTGAGRADIGLKIDALCLGLNFGLNMVLIPRFGILGAATATTASLVLAATVFLLLVPRILKVRIDFKWYAQAMGSAAIAVVLFVIGARMISPYLAGAAILCAYLALVVTLLLTKEDRTTLKSLAYSLMPGRLASRR